MWNIIDLEPYFYKDKRNNRWYSEKDLDELVKNKEEFFKIIIALVNMNNGSIEIPKNKYLGLEEYELINCGFNLSGLLLKTRKCESVKEYTIQQLEEKLGEKIKIIGEKESDKR